jgi:cation diffusion facilitator family transporter
MFSWPARRYIILSIGAALLTMAIKFAAYLLTGSVGLLSDAAESLVNLAAALIAFWALTVAARPPDEEHAYGHSKVEYFSSGAEGALILLAAATIVYAAIPRLIHPQPIERPGLGLALAVGGAVINGGVGWILLQAGRRLRSISLEADARHLFTDVWTTVAVIVAVFLVVVTGVERLDPIIALLVAANIIWTGVRLLRQTGAGLLDPALPATEQALITSALEPYREQGIQFHALRTRQSGVRRFISLHVLVPGNWSVQRGHDLCERIEADIRQALPESTIFTHLEPREDPRAWADQELDRSTTGQAETQPQR